MRCARHWLPLVLFAAGCTAPPPRTAFLISVADSVNLGAIAIGQGPDTVLVLGGGPAFGAAYLEPLLAPLGESHTLILLDLRGRARSTPTLLTSLDQDVADLEAARAQLRLSRFAVVAHHYGVLVATAFATRYPGRVARIAALGPFPPRARYQFDLALEPKDSAWRAQLEQAYRIGGVEADPVVFCRAAWEVHLAPADRGDPAVLRDLQSGICDAPASVLRSRGALKTAILQSLGDWEWRDSLRTLSVPLLVVSGTRDAVLLHSARTWAYYAPDGGITELNASPLVPWVGQQHDVRAALGTFLDGRWPRDVRKPLAAEVRAPGDSLLAATARATQ